MMTTFLCCVIGALSGYIYHLIQNREYWKDKALAEAKKRLTKDTERENAHRAEVHRLNQMLTKKSEQIQNLERNNNVLRQLNDQLVRKGGNL